MRYKIFLVICLILAVAAGGYFTFSFIKESHREIETMSAKIEMELEDVNADSEGTIKEIKVKSHSSVKLGDIIAEISKRPTKNCADDKAYKKASDTYKDSALMYKDGIITKDEYDASLKKYKSEKSNLCSSKVEVVPVYAEHDGVFIKDDDYNSGSTVHEESIIGVIRPEKIIVKAYFSPKDTKRIKVGQNAQVTIIKYPEKQLAATVASIDKIDINGQGVTLEITDNTANLNVAGDDAAIVKLVK